MYVRLITYHVKPWVTQDHAAPVYNEMLNAMRHLSGFQGLSLLLNEEARQAISLSYWKSEASAAEAGPQILPYLMGRAQEFVDRAPEISGFELVRQDALPLGVVAS